MGESPTTENQLTPTRPGDKRDIGGLMSIAFWFGGSAVLGWQANVAWHDHVHPNCLDSASEPHCWDFGDLHYQFVAVAAAAGASWVAGKWTKKAFKLPFKGSMMCFDSSRLKSDQMLLEEKEQIHGRWLHELVHAGLCTGLFFFWKYIKDNEADPTNDRVREWIQEIPIYRSYFQGFVAIVPTICAEWMAVSAYKKNPTDWFLADGKWAFASVAIKAALFVASDFLLAPETQRVWDHPDDSPSQRNIVILVAALAGMLIVTFWKMVASACNAASSASHYCYQGWACTDFPIFMLICAQLAWNVTARLDNQHDLTLTFDFLFQVAYAYLFLLGILNIQVHRMSTTTVDAAFPMGGRSQIKFDVVRTVAEDSDDESGAL